MGNLIYCSHCGAQNQTRQFDGRSRQVCPNCGTIHYENPLPAVVILVVAAGRLLLIRRGVPPGKGHWSLPGGFMELRESLTQAAGRELTEETGLTAETLKLLGGCPHPGGVRGDVLVIGCTADGISGELAPGDDAVEATFFDRQHLPPVVFACHRELIRMYLEGKTIPDVILQAVPGAPGGA